MKLLRYGLPGLERPGLLDGAGRIRDLSAHVHDVAGTTLLPATLQRLAAIDHKRLPLVEPGTRIGPCIAGVGKLICVGRDDGSLHLKASSAICGPDDAARIPPGRRAVHCTLRLGIVIGQPGRLLTPSEVMTHVAGCCLVTDIHAAPDRAQACGNDGRDSNFDTFLPLGPWLVTTADGSHWCNVDVAAVVASISRFMSLQSGDVIAIAGITPEGPQPEPISLEAGEEAHLGIEGLGQQRVRAIPTETTAK